VGLPTLAALQVGSAFALDTLGQLDVSVAKDASFESLLDSSSGIAQSTFFGSPIQLKLQKFVAS
jgi:hypothetical protein